MAIFDEKFEIRERCKGVHCVDLGESFPTRIYLQKSASIQPRTSPSKFGGKIQFTIHFTPYRPPRLRRPATATQLSAASSTEPDPSARRPQRPALSRKQRRAAAVLSARPARSQARLRTPVNNSEYFPPNFEGLVLGCIDADFCK